MKVLVIDDEPQIRRALRAGLERTGYAVQAASSGEEGLTLASERPPDIVILDLAMPGTDGFAVCEELRRWTKIPIIVLSVRDREDDKIRALDLGADDYLIKPFGVGELLARMRAVMRRSLGNDEDTTDPTFEINDLKVDYVNRLVTVAGEEIHLTPKEYDLLKCLIQYRNRVMTHSQLLAKVWGPEQIDDTHTLRVHMANLRSKIEHDPARPQYIRTEPRIGYRFKTDE
ncbi:MAG: response regulator transcription factor [Candidatus Obscuribacterales bacterium]|nr:response regulator transcription factor [Candidatus Obscuribacterales bacterium]